MSAKKPQKSKRGRARAGSRLLNILLVPQLPAVAGSLPTVAFDNGRVEVQGWGIGGEVLKVRASVLRASRSIPGKPPATSRVAVVVPKSENESDYLFIDDGISDNRVRGAKAGIDNVLVTWARFQGGERWVRSHVVMHFECT